MRPAAETPTPDAPLTLASVRRMLEGVIPAALCTLSADGEPHVCFLSQAEYVDEAHVALSFQFFNRSRANVLATRRAALSVEDPYTAGGLMLQLEYLRTESGGALFERMKTRLAGIASHAGMDSVFRLQGADIYRVLSVQRVPGRGTLAASAPRCELPAGSRALAERLAACADIGELLDATMAGLHEHLRIEHAMLLLADAASGRLYTVASRGYERSGIGSEIALGEGVAGMAAREGVPIRIGHLTTAHTYGRAVRSQAEALGLQPDATEIPLPGLREPRSQMAVPLRIMGRVTGVLLVESRHDQHFGHDDEDALTVLATQLALALTLLQPPETAEAPVPTPRPGTAVPAPADAQPLRVRHFKSNDSIFLGHDYLIKGVAGAIFWRLANDHVREGRCEFSNRELRLDPALRLPDVTENLEARLILLQRRLAERPCGVVIEKTGRGRFRLVVQRPLQLESA